TEDLRNPRHDPDIAHQNGGPGDLPRAYQLSALRDPGHAQVGLGTTCAIGLPDQTREVLVGNHARAECARDGIDGDVVVSRPHAAAGEHHVVALAQLADLAC